MPNIFTAEFNTVLISTILTIVIAGGAWVVAWLKAKTKHLNEMAEANKAILEENTKIARTIEKQTDGMQKKLSAIAEAVGFARGRLEGRKEGESPEAYEELESLESLYRGILDEDRVRQDKAKEEMEHKDQ